MGFMAADNAPEAMQFVPMFVLALVNAGLYGVIGAAFSRLRQNRQV